MHLTERHLRVLNKEGLSNPMNPRVVAALLDKAAF